MKHLAGHAGPVAAVTVNELTGDIVTCAGSWLYLWDINGRLQVGEPRQSQSFPRYIRGLPFIMSASRV